MYLTAIQRPKADKLNNIHKFVLFLLQTLKCKNL